MERYNEYKDSGVQWLGEIPSHWEVNKFKNLYNTRTGITFTKAQLEESGEPVISYGQIHSKENKYSSVNPVLIRHIPSTLTEGSSGALAVNGDFLFADTSEDFEGCGNCVYVDTDYPIYAGYHTILAKKNNIECGQYFAYLFACQSWRGQVRSMVNGVKVYSITQTILKNTTIILPPISEQQAIASYLDEATSKIDAAIAQQQKMIDLLNERKQIIINNAVTKGLNPNVKMKDSGVDWIGEIPEEWEVNRLKALTTNMRNGYVGPTRNLYQDAGVPYIQSLHVKNGTIDFNKKEYYVSPQWANKHPKIYKDDLVIVQTGDIGNTAIITEEFNGCNCHALIIVKVNKEIVIPEYLCFYLRSKVGKELMLQTKTGALLPHLNTTEIGTTIVIVPTIEEQRDIVNYLKEEIQKVESLIKIFEKQIFLLQERKQIIINEVVTGKVKVTK